MRNYLKNLGIFAFVVFPLLAGCGGGGGGGGGGAGEAQAATNVAALTASGASELGSNVDCSAAVDLPESLQSTWDETQQCTALSATPPKVLYSPTVVCPRNRQEQCLSTVPFFACSSDPSQLCGAIGRFLPQCNAIELPDRYAGAAAHEMIHYLLRASGQKNWATHESPDFVCQ